MWSHIKKRLIDNMKFTFAMTFAKLLFAPSQHKSFSLHFTAFDDCNKSVRRRRCARWPWCGNDLQCGANLKRQPAAETSPLQRSASTGAARRCAHCRLQCAVLGFFFPGSRNDTFGARDADTMRRDVDWFEQTTEGKPWQGGRSWTSPGGKTSQRYRHKSALWQLKPFVPLQKKS